MYWTPSKDQIEQPVSSAFDVSVGISRGVIHLTEGDQPQDILVSTTIPLGCQYSCNESDSHICTADIQISFSPNVNKEIAVLFDGSSESTVCGSDLNVTASYGLRDHFSGKISLYPKDDGKVDGTQHVEGHLILLSFGVLWTGMTLDFQV